MTNVNEVSPPGWGHTKAEKEKTKPNKPKSKIGGTADAMKKAQKRGDIPKNMNIFALMWSMKNKGDKPHYKPGVKDKLKKKYKGPEGQNEEKKVTDQYPPTRLFKNVPNSTVKKANKEGEKAKKDAEKSVLGEPPKSGPSGENMHSKDNVYEEGELVSLVAQAIKKLPEAESDWAKQKRIDKEISDRLVAQNVEREKRYQAQQAKQKQAAAKKEEVEIDEKSGRAAAERSTRKLTAKKAVASKMGKIRWRHNKGAVEEVEIDEKKDKETRAAQKHARTYKAHVKRRSTGVPAPLGRNAKWGPTRGADKPGLTARKADRTHKRERGVKKVPGEKGRQYNLRLKPPRPTHDTPIAGPKGKLPEYVEIYEASKKLWKSVKATDTVFDVVNNQNKYGSYGEIAVSGWIAKQLGVKNPDGDHYIYFDDADLVVGERGDTAVRGVLSSRKPIKMGDLLKKAQAFVKKKKPVLESVEVEIVDKILALDYKKFGFETQKDLMEYAVSYYCLDERGEEPKFIRPHRKLRWGKGGAKGSKEHHRRGKDDYEGGKETQVQEWGDTSILSKQTARISGRPDTPKKQKLSITPAGKKALKKGDQKLSITAKGRAAVKEGAKELEARNAAKADKKQQGGSLRHKVWPASASEEIKPLSQEFVDAIHNSKWIGKDVEMEGSIKSGGDYDKKGSREYATSSGGARVRKHGGNVGDTDVRGKEAAGQSVDKFPGSARGFKKVSSRDADNPDARHATFKQRRPHDAARGVKKVRGTKEDMSLAPKGKGRKAAKALYKEWGDTGPLHKQRARHAGRPDIPKKKEKKEEVTHFGDILRQAIEEAKKVDAIKEINKIVKTKTMGKLHGQKVDLFTASAIQSVYNALNKKNQQKMTSVMSKDVHGLLKMADFSMRQMKR